MTGPKKFKTVDSKVDFIQIEHEMLEKWNKDDTFNQLKKKNSKGKSWSFIDGPITANNPMGVHHAWGRTLKDIFQRYHAMQGRELRYQNGFDCQELWVEHKIQMRVLLLKRLCSSGDHCRFKKNNIIGIFVYVRNFFKHCLNDVYAN